MTTFLRRTVLPAALLLLVLTILTGVLYPLSVTAVAQVAFPAQANGSLLEVGGRSVGSTLIGQVFDEPAYLWGRPSAAGSDGYDGMASAGSQLGPTSQDLVDRVAAQVEAWRSAYGDAPIPVDLVTTSASGLDANISPAGAAYQVPRIAAARGIPDAEVQAVIDRHTEGAMLGFLGQPRVNVLLVNLDLDGLLR